MTEIKKQEKMKSEFISFQKKRLDYCTSFVINAKFIELYPDLNCQKLYVLI